MLFFIFMLNSLPSLVSMCKIKKKMVKLTGIIILEDFIIGSQISVEFHYHTLGIQKNGEKPDEIGMTCAEMSAVNVNGVVEKHQHAKNLVSTV